MSKRIDVSFEVLDDISAEELIWNIGSSLAEVLSATELESDGFGRLTPDEKNRQHFVSPERDPLDFT